MVDSCLRLMSGLLYVSLWVVVWPRCLQYYYLYLLYDLLLSCYLVLSFFSVVKIGGGDDWNPCGAGILKDGSGNGFAGVG